VPGDMCPARGRARDYARVRAGGTRDDVDRQFAAECLNAVLAAQQELTIVAAGIHTVLQAAYRARSMRASDSR